MESLIIERTETSPQIILDPIKNRFEFSGDSRPENAREFYMPVIKWLQQYSMNLYWKKNELNQKTGITIEFKFDYFNSTSAKYILDIFLILQKMEEQDHNVLIKWYYEENDLDIKEAGEEFLGSVIIPHEYVVR